MKPVLFNNTVLRDGHQSMAATRMTTAQMLPAAPELDSLGFGVLETWGGAAIDSCLRFLGEQPFDRVRALRKVVSNTPQSMLLRGQNIVQYTCFPDDVVSAFVEATADAGIEVFRIFDALNDIRNLATSIETVRRKGKHARGEICYTISPVHTVKLFVEFACELKEMGCHSLAIKDMAGVITPQIAAELVREIKKQTALPLTLHSHDSAGLAATSYCAAIDAGVDAIETSISPFANGTSQPDTLRMLFLLENHPRAPKFDRAKLASLREYFTGVYQELSDFTSSANEVVESDTLIYQVPGGMLSNFRVQLRDLGMTDRQAEVLAEIPVVREALGWPPLVTPISQIVGSQAMLNVKFGRWKNFSPAAMDIALGCYGETPAAPDTEVVQLAEKQSGKSVRTDAPSTGLPPRMDSLREELSKKGLPTDKEAAVLYAMFPQEFEHLHKKEEAPVKPTQPTTPPLEISTPSPSTKPSTEKARKLSLTIDGRKEDYWIEDLD